jgi:hypothetical protein
VNEIEAERIVEAGITILQVAKPEAVRLQHNPATAIVLEETSLYAPRMGFPASPGGA